MDWARGAAVLKSKGWLAATPADFQEALLGACTWRAFDAGDAIVTAGDPARALYGVAEGSVSVVTASGPPDTPLSHIFHAGGWIGYIPLISGRTAANSTVARTPVFASVLTASAFERLVGAQPGWWRHFAILGLDYGYIAANIAADLLIRDSRRRCAAALLRLAGCRFEDPASGRAEAWVGQADLATIANLSRNTTNRILREFSAAGLIHAGYNCIALANTPALREVVDEERSVRAFG